MLASALWGACFRRRTIFTRTHLSVAHVHKGKSLGLYRVAAGHTLVCGVVWCLCNDRQCILYTSCGAGLLQRRALSKSQLFLRCGEIVAQHVLPAALTHQPPTSFAEAKLELRCLAEAKLELRCLRFDDVVLATRQGFKAFHVYVCAVFLIYWSRQAFAVAFAWCGDCDELTPMKDDAALTEMGP
eukprot:946739-Amphidinium_carterae.2